MNEGAAMDNETNSGLCVSRAQAPGRPLPGSDSVCHFNLAMEIAELRRQASFQRTGRNAKTLVKHDDFRVVVVVLKSGARLQEHRVAGRLSIQVLSGLVRVGLAERGFFVPLGQMLVLDRCVQHAVEAFEESALLLSLSFPESAVVEECRPQRCHAS
jgi:quercetin dioxygenase-like cupin family protein